MFTEEGRIVLSKALPLVEGIDNAFFDNLETEKQCFNSLLLNWLSRTRIRCNILGGIDLN